MSGWICLQNLLFENRRPIVNLGHQRITDAKWWKTFLFMTKQKVACCYITNSSDFVFTVQYYVINILNNIQKMLLFNVFLFFFYPRQKWQTLCFYSAASSSGDGSYCISWKMILKQSLEVTAGATVLNTGTAAYLYI